MIPTVMLNLFQALIGFSGGLAVGGGFVAFITLLGIIPRLVQLSKTDRYVRVYSASVVFGLFAGSYLTFTDIYMNQTFLALALWGIFHGMFNGMLAASLTEVLNVFPILFKRIGLNNYLIVLLMALVFGKVFGSLFQWTIFVKY
ncbi:MAG TPA: stage V sporulation protein AB [Pseudogracilibacillus sp.]|nr:stage V sporulation protein AB [Pseudogracilibacillus sp.]